MMIMFLTVIQGLAFGLLSGPQAAPQFLPGTTRVICQVTGDYDTYLLRPTLSRTQTRASVIGTDLGSSFEHQGRLCFLFGDTQGALRKDADSFAWSDSTDPQHLVLDFPVDAQGRFMPITIPGVQQGSMCVPTGGISLNGSMYIVYATDWYNPNGSIDSNGNVERSVLARSDDRGLTWRVIYDLAKASNHDMEPVRFINVCMRQVPAVTWEGLPGADRDRVLLWGSGAYRKSDLFLACIPVAQIEDKAALRYFAGLDSTGRPTWDADSTAASPLFFDNRIGELSVAWIEPLGRWVLLYNAGLQGICLRMAEQPWGPWTQATYILDREFMTEQDWAGAYGPYIVERFTVGDPNRCTLTYMTSAWNPYQAFLMRSDLGRPIPPAAHVEAIPLLPADEGWHTSSQDVFRRFERGGCPYITTYAKGGDAAKGLTWTLLPHDANNVNLEFRLHGGHAEVLLLQGSAEIPTQGDPALLYPLIRSGQYGPVLHRIKGRDSNETDVNVSWDLAGYQEPWLKVLVIDWLNEPWGFVSVSQMRLIRAD